MSKSQRDHLMHSTGTTPYEIIGVILPSLFYTTITTIIVTLLQTRPKNLPLQFTIEFLTLVLPIILNVTVLSDYTFELLSTFLIITLSLILWLRGSKPLSAKPPQAPLTHDYITNSRSTINIISVIAILAVDFLIFPRRFAKTKTYGYSLMDVGVGLFIFSNGIVDAGRTDLGRSLKGAVPLLVLGVGRFFGTKLLGYHVPVTEYGVHWNFFISLAVIKIVVSLVFSVIEVKYIFINATLLLLSHESLLQGGLKNFVMDDHKRSNFLTANREGIISCFGYVSLYMFSANFSYFVGLKKGGEGVKKTVIKFVFLATLMLFLSQIWQKYCGISRKLANSAYCFWVLFIGIFMTGLYYIFAKILEDTFRNKLHVNLQLPLIFQAINYNGLVFFLVSNLLTGLVNVLCDTLQVSSVVSLGIITVYMLVNCAIVCVLFTKQIKLKL
ncbi:uncharacterized protein LOC107397980 [Tribolium castaneum]|uniref:Phosphatidylinositol-glycan biosynthesis class W protein n=1 Tax=Tribolium castaneum TaxID=7070 RepID=D6WM59_TRICA|nr:PREDICTED: uncharacterized protein At4g17910-like [Tribolium castaneum]XP_015835826.1 PREDICTED: uncharacterized protein At4g17910-like [Tribolium castaneum]EFA04229.1 GPI-anchored wall transfer protein 1-like Protein [Tribolium castaneum]|eukprot:XP_015835825.1 PREDICTED: uncharacterized protein At4g17910-like [Tribolium castaneum]